MKRFFATLALSSSLWLISSASMAQVTQTLYSANDPARFSGWCVDNESHNVAVKFIVPLTKNYDLTAIKAPFEIIPNDPPTNISMDVFKWTANGTPPSDPTDLIARLPINETLPTADPTADPIPQQVDYSFSSATPVHLEAGKAYWIQFNVTSPSCVVSVLGGNEQPTAHLVTRDAEYQNYSNVWTDRTSNFYTQLELIGNLTPPTLQDDSRIVSRVASTDIDVLTNDQVGVVLDTTFPLVLSNPSAGTLSYVGNQIQFNPASTFSDPVTFTYKACTPDGACSTALVTLQPEAVTPSNPGNPGNPTPVPTLNQWSLLVLSSLLICLACMRQRRKP
ncbi:IPTL-CTERM sorting domain-containing protein [Comamonas sediminis]|uniref:IPTL-CTERM sorting domain-containing protein n=1 Tax=Comamonas sediminis TaxID=1783360 RepID=A0ABV4B1U4_9BURK